MPADHPLFILYSSGSIAQPGASFTRRAAISRGGRHSAGRVRPPAGFRCLLVFSRSVGWVIGHSYIVYGPLANNTSMVVFEDFFDHPARTSGGTSSKRCNSIFYTAPTAIRACMKWGVENPNKHDLSSLRLLGSVREPINPKAWLWYHKVIGHGRCPVVDTWWQTGNQTDADRAFGAASTRRSPARPRTLQRISAALVNQDGNENRKEAPGLSW